MSALPPDQMHAMRTAAQRALHPVASLAERWEVLHRQVAELAALAQLAPEAPRADTGTFTSMLTEAQDWQRELAWQAIADIDAMMQPGLTALKVITARGRDASAPALALWREFHAAREAVLRVIKVAQTEAA